MPINIQDFAFTTERIPRQLVETLQGSVQVTGTIPTSGYLKITGTPVETSVDNPAVYIATTIPRNTGDLLSGDKVYGNSTIYIGPASGTNQVTAILGVDVIGSTAIPYVILSRNSGTGTTPLVTETYNMILWICATPSN